VIPLTSRLDAILKMRQTGRDGEDLPPDAYVFGNEVGEQQDSITTVSKLHATARRFEIARRTCTTPAQNEKGAPETPSEAPSGTPASAVH
jgi:hypothetical protein